MGLNVHLERNMLDENMLTLRLHVRLVRRSTTSKISTVTTCNIPSTRVEVNPFLAKSFIFFPISHKKTTQPIGLPTT